MSAAVLRTGATVIVVWCSTSLAGANPHSLVPSGGDLGNAGNFSVTYEYALDKTIISRERVGIVGDGPVGAIPKRTDLLFNQYSHTITPRVDLGVFPDTWLSVALPVIVQQARELRLADGVTRADSTTLQDGLLPTDGFDARDPGTALGDDLVFRGANRSGLTQVHLGLGFAPMNQRRDPTKPTWKLGAEVRLAIGKTMDFDREKIADRTGVSSGVHELRLWTTVAKKFGRFEPWVELFWQAPIATRDGALFKEPGFGATNTTLGQVAGGSFGLEAYAVDDPINGNRISADLGARIVSHFEGRGYSEMWEVFAFAGDSRVTGNPLMLDADPTETGLQGLSHPGITNIENHLETAMRMALRAQLGPHVHLAAIVDVAWKTDHAITFADAGVDLPVCNGTSAQCEDDDNDVVNQNTGEVNPLHAPKVDLAGHRYRAEDSLSVVIGVQGRVVF